MPPSLARSPLYTAHALPSLHWLEDVPPAPHGPGSRLPREDAPMVRFRPLPLARSKRGASPLMRHTKIVCTLGPASRYPDTVAAMVRRGMDFALLNTSHATLAEHVRVV